MLSAGLCGDRLFVGSCEFKTNPGGFIPYNEVLYKRVRLLAGAPVCSRFFCDRVAGRARAAHFV